jgi:hypothetical protein
MVIGGSLPLPWKFAVSPFIVAQSGAPYNITTGRDTNGDIITAERPALVALGAAQCTGRDLHYASDFGCFNLNPAGAATISRNYGRGPGSFNMNLRLARTWTLGKGESRATNPMGGMMMGGGMGGGGGMHGGGGPPPGAVMTAPPPGMMGAGMGAGTGQPHRTYNLTLSLNANNLLNHVNWGTPGGDLSSPYFGQYRNLAGGFITMSGPGGGTYNRKVDVQLRLAF